MMRTATRTSGNVAHGSNHAASRTTNERQMLAAVRVASMVNSIGVRRAVAVRPCDRMTNHTADVLNTAVVQRAAAAAAHPRKLTGLAAPSISRYTTAASAALSPFDVMLNRAFMSACRRMTTNTNA